MSQPILATPIAPPIAPPITPSAPTSSLFADMAKLTDGIAKLATLADKHLSPLVTKAAPLVAKAVPVVVRTLRPSPQTEATPSGDVETLEVDDETDRNHEKSSEPGYELGAVPDCGEVVEVATTEPDWDWGGFDVSGWDFSGLADAW